jgi:hypothetical protein
VRAAAVIGDDNKPLFVDSGTAASSSTKKVWWSWQQLKIDEY